MGIKGGWGFDVASHTSQEEGTFMITRPPVTRVLPELIIVAWAFQMVSPCRPWPCRYFTMTINHHCISASRTGSIFLGTIRRPPTRSILFSQRHRDSIPDPRLFFAARFPVSTSACSTMKTDDQSWPRCRLRRSMLSRLSCRITHKKHKEKIQMQCLCPRHDPLSTK